MLIIKRSWVLGSIWELPVFPSQLFYKSKSTLKERVYLKIDERVAGKAGGWWGFHGRDLAGHIPLHPTSASRGSTTAGSGGPASAGQGYWVPAFREKPGASTPWPLATLFYKAKCSGPSPLWVSLFSSACSLSSPGSDIERRAALPASEGAGLQTQTRIVSLPGELEKGSRAVGTMDPFVHCSEIQSPRSSRLEREGRVRCSGLWPRVPLILLLTGGWGLMRGIAWNTE